MPQPYNLSNITAANNLYELAKASNELASGYLGMLLLLGTFIVFFFSFKGFETKKAFAGASFITSIAAMLLRIMNFIGDVPMFSVFLLAGISIVWLRFSE